MCGICGVAYKDRQRPVSPELIRRMQDTIAHRGPDGEGTETWPGVGFGHRRLSIIDVVGGRQPLSNEDGSVWITFNGEVYNYRELTRELIRRGHHFHTRSDTEAIVHAYEEYGLDFVRYLNGMFAFAIYDIPRRRVVLARDHVGVKPLFYSITSDGLFFGSEIKAVLTATGAPVRARAEAVAEYLTFRYVAGSGSFFDGVHRLPAAHIAVWEDGVLSVRRYWSVPADRQENCSLNEATEQLDARLRASVESQLMSEVPLGAFCSGGVDSGLITRYASQAAATKPFRTFSVGFDDPEWDEGALARDTANRFGTSHHSIIARAADFEQYLQGLTRKFDEPLSHPNSVPIFRLSQLARQDVTVVLTGEGSDEVFGGYPRYHLWRLRSALNHVPFASSAVSRLLHLQGGRRAQLAAELLALPLQQSALLNSRYVPLAAVQRIVRTGFEGAYDERLRIWKEMATDNPTSSFARYEISTYLTSLLDRIDRMTMAVSLEGRVPFLDVPLLEWSATLPHSLRLKGRENKRVVKHLARRWLSPRITDGPKSGFGVPLDKWFRNGEFSFLVNRMLNADHPAAQHFDMKCVSRLISEHRAGHAAHGQILWLIANVFVWYDSHVQPPREAPTGPKSAVRRTLVGG